MKNANRIRNAGVGKELANKLDTPRILHRVRDVFKISSQYANGTAIAEVKTGAYTYQFFQIGITSTAAIAGKTIERNGKHYVKTANLGDYIDAVRLEIDGQERRDMTMSDFSAMNGYRDYDVTDGFVYMTFGGPNLFHDLQQEDAYMLGTNNIRDLRLVFDLKSAWDEPTMKLDLVAEYASVRRNVEYLETHKTFREIATAVGWHEFKSIPIKSNLAGIYVFAPNLTKAKLTIDDVEMFNGDVYQQNAALALYGRDVAALGDGVFFDFWRGMEAQKGLQGLRSQQQLRRNASIDLELHVDTEDTEIRVFLMQCGRYQFQS